MPLSLLLAYLPLLAMLGLSLRTYPYGYEFFFCIPRLGDIYLPIAM